VPALTRAGLGAEMKLLAATIMLFFVLALNGADAQTVSASNTAQTAPVENSQTIKITRNGLQQPNKGPAEYFTGSVQVEPLFSAHDSSRVSGGG
jgi:hypothetical protein